MEREGRRRAPSETKPGNQRGRGTAAQDDVRDWEEFFQALEQQDEQGTGTPGQGGRR